MSWRLLILSRLSKVSWSGVLLLGGLVAAMAEVKVNPFGTTFRFGLGPPTLLFGVLMWRQIAPTLAGLSAALSVMALRTAITLWPGASGEISLGTALQIHAPAAVYYIVLGAFAQALVLPRLIHKPLALTGLIGAADAVANLAEAALRGMPVLSWPVLQSLLTVAAIRTAVVSGLFFIGQQQVYELRLREQKQQYNRLLAILIDLRTETFFLQKSATGIEQIMAQCYGMYTDAPNRAWGEKALEVAKEIHEVKKDQQRVVAGLEQILRRRELPESMCLTAVLALVVEANQAYARKRDKDIAVTYAAGYDFETAEYAHWASILNNLVSNAIEAIDQAGTVRIMVEAAGPHLVITVADDGPGIRARDPQVVFQPGYTTRVDEATGRYTRGLGLAHVRSLAELLGGEVSVERTGPEGTIFRLVFPLGQVAAAQPEVV